MRKKTLYVVAGTYGGLIDTAEICTDKKKAIKRARCLWKGAKKETSDVKVITNGSEIVWGPKN